MTSLKSSMKQEDQDWNHSATGSKKWLESASQTRKESNCQRVIRPTCTETTREVTFLTVPGVTVLAHEFPIEKKKRVPALQCNGLIHFNTTLTEAFTAPRRSSSTGWEGANECACRYLITPSSAPSWQQRKWVQREATSSVKTFTLSCADSCCCVYVGEQPALLERRSARLFTFWGISEINYQQVRRGGIQKNVAWG